LFHNSNLFGSCIIHILYTVCAKIKECMVSSWPSEWPWNFSAKILKLWLQWKSS